MPNYDNSGIAQYLLLRRYLERVGWWIWASTAGWGVWGLVVSGAFTNMYLALVVGFFPAIATNIALWLLLDWYPRHNQNPAQL